MWQSGKTIIMLKAETDSAGLLLQDAAEVLRRAGRRPEADGRDGSTASGPITTTRPAQLIPNGAMGLLAGAFVPDDYAKWPVLDPNDPDIQADIAMLEKIGKPSGGEMDHEHMNHDRP